MMWTPEVSRLTFGRDGMLYMSIGGPGTGPPPSLDRPQHATRLRRQANPDARRRVAAAGQSVCRQEGIQAVHLRDGLSQSARPDDESLQRRDLGRGTGAEWRRRGKCHPAGQELRLAVRQLRSRLPWPALQRRARRARIRRADAVLGTGHRRVRHDVLQRRSISRTGAATCSWAECARARCRQPASCSGLRSTTTGRNCAASRCCATCISGFATSGRDPDGLLYVITDEDQAALLKIEPQ